MKTQDPPLYARSVIIPEYNQDPAHNRRELDECLELAVLTGGVVRLPAGEWPIDPPRDSFQPGESCGNV